MSDSQTGSTKAADPLDQWRELRDAYIDIWAKASGEAVNSEAYAQASGTMLEAFLSTSSPFRDAQKKVMVSALEQCNMPSRDDYVRMAERLSNLELLLDDMDSRLRQIHQIVSKASVQPAAAAQHAPAKPIALTQPVTHTPSATTAPSEAPKPAITPAAPAPSLKAQPSMPELFGVPEPPIHHGSAAKSGPRKLPAKNSKKGSK
jgi:hypothetical protein